MYIISPLRSTNISVECPPWHASRAYLNQPAYSGEKDRERANGVWRAVNGEGEKVLQARRRKRPVLLIIALMEGAME